MSTAVDTSRKVNWQSLVNEGVAITRKIEELKERLAEIKAELEPFFPAEKTQEMMMTDTGVAIRKVSHKWKVDQGAIDRIKEIVGEDQLYEYVYPSTTYKVTAKCRTVAMSADSEIGFKLRSCIHIDQTVSISFKPRGKA